jgi:hypothetical protein
LLADEFVFTSPQDDHIDRTAFKTGERHRNVEVLTVRGDQITEAPLPKNPPPTFR